MKTSRRFQNMKPSIFTDLKQEKAAYELQTGQRVLDFSLGSPNIPPAQQVMDTLAQAAEIPASYKYAIQPLPALLEAIQDWYMSRYNVQLSEDEICLLQGSQEALMNLPLLYCNPGDAVIIPDPYYPAYADAPKLAEASLIYAPLRAENDYLIDFDALEKEDLSHARILLVCYPNNPTGAIAPDWFVNELIAFARRHDLLVLYDSAYSDLDFSKDQGKSFLSYPGARDVGVELNSFSKSYGMAGARLGVLCGNQEVIREYKALKSNMDYGVFIPVQKAGITALQTGASIVSQTKAIYEKRRQLIQELFAQAGWKLELPQGTMFIWAPIPESFSDSFSFAKELLWQTGILVTPGSSFGKEGDRFVRLALVIDEQDIIEAANRLKSVSFF